MTPARPILALLLPVALIFQALSGAEADYDAALQQFHSGQYEKCLDEVNAAINDNAYGEQWHVLRIRAHLALGQFREALESTVESLDRYPNSIQVRWAGIQAAQFNGLDNRAELWHDEIHNLESASGWRYRDSQNQVTLGQSHLARGTDAKLVLDRFFRSVLSRTARHLEANMAIANVALNKQDFQLAAEHFQTVAELDEKNPDAVFGLALSFAESDRQRSAQLMERALLLNPRHAPTLLEMVSTQIDAENYSGAEAILQKIFETNPHEPDAWAYRAVLAHLSNDSEQEQEYRDKALGHWNSNPHIDYLIGKKLSQKYRFREGAQYQRRALRIAADYLPAKMQLANDLLRLGNELEGWKLADEVYDRDGYNILAHNLVTLRDNLSGFATIERNGFVVRMSKHEAAIYGESVLDLLIDAETTLAEKYDFEVNKPVVVEIFPRQQDFAIRTFGLPGGAGFLGVCFGHVITMNSPASQTGNPQNWRSVLWHEFCHVVTLQKTNNKMPRWLSEGISVYEERQANRAWGESMNVRYREMILGDDLTPVSELSGAFLSPPSAEHLQFAYYESSLVVEYLIDKYGVDVINRILVDLGVGMPINESLGRYTGSVKLLDKEFAEYARQMATDYAKDVDLTLPDAEAIAQPGGLVQWAKENPDSFFAKLQVAKLMIEGGQMQQAKEIVEGLVELHPEYQGPSNPYRLLAQIHRELGDGPAELDALDRLLQRDAQDLDGAIRACELAAEAEDWERTLAFATRARSISPLIPGPHRWASVAAENLGDDEQVIQSLKAQSLMDPLDPADIHYRLANRLHRSQRSEEALREVLKALEYAPRYRDAHKLLLQIVEGTESSVDDGEGPSDSGGFQR